jgi:hypothetical protein
MPDKEPTKPVKEIPQRGPVERGDQTKGDRVWKPPVPEKKPEKK